jgi:polyvinyl alcohol dehydrogenase (cytochrome)
MINVGEMRVSRILAAVAIAVLLAVLAGCSGLGARPGPAVFSLGEWPTYMNGIKHTGYTENTTITRQNAGQVEMLWKINPDEGFEQFDSVFSQPVISGDRIYFGSWDGNEYAVDHNGQVLWKAFLGRTVDPTNCVPLQGGVSGTAALADSMNSSQKGKWLYVTGGDGSLYALNADTGETIWSTHLGDPPASYLWSSPVLYNGSVFTAMASFGDCPLVRAFVVKLDAKSGKIQNTFYTVPENCVGGSVWSVPSIDPETGVLYVTTGNAEKCGDQAPYQNAILALNTKDLSYVDHWQVPQAEWVVDSDFGATPTLFETSAGRKLVGAGNKNGMYYALDRSDLKAGPVWKVRLAEGGPCPQCGQGVLAPTAFDGKRLYSAGGQTTIQGKTCGSSLRAHNPDDGTVLWETCLPVENDPFPAAITGAVTVTPDLVLAGYARSVVILGKDNGEVLNTLTVQADENLKHPPPYFWGPPSIAAGMIFAGNMSGEFIAFGVKGQNQ